MGNIKKQMDERVAWIKQLLIQSNTSGIVFGASGGKDSILVGALCRKATKNITGLIMPCESHINYTTDKEHALIINKKFDIRTEEVDLTSTKQTLRKVLEPLSGNQNSMAYANINPRLRMIALYNYAQRNNYLVAGTSNRSERLMGYFTKWGDGACDFNPIADLTVKEVYKYLELLDIPDIIKQKAPSAGLYDNQTDEMDLGVTYSDIDNYILNNEATKEVQDIILETARKTDHKRRNIMFFDSEKVQND